MGGVGASALLVPLGGASAQDAYGPQVTASSTNSVSTFYDALSPYGTWVQLPDVGWVWRPNPTIVGSDFVPYATGGQWTYSDWGWTFETNWNWGWAPFHYGRWFLSAANDWVWWPDNEWAPSWVDWRWGDGFVGWQPLGPPGIDINLGLSWNFVGVNDFVRPHVGQFVVPRSRVPVLLRRTQGVGERVPARVGEWNRGPAPNRVAQTTGRAVPRSRIAPPPTAHPPRARSGPQTPRGGSSAMPRPQQPPPRPGSPPHAAPRPEAPAHNAPRPETPTHNAPKPDGYQPAPRAEPAPRPEPMPHAEPAPRPEPAPHAEPAPRPEPAPHAEPVPHSEPAPRPEPVPHSEPAPRPESAPHSSPAPHSEPHHGR
ncbi:DUF6600 domain-containing protein [Myxococcus sp. AM011]|uniref:DUF6600 domain-containing protein n=1 Tax=Myxococcus sp. AM011 TaxID=2745200 RepID=UPI0034CE5273